MKPEEEEKMDNLNRISDLVYEALESNEKEYRQYARS